MMKLTIKNNSEKHIIVKLNQGESLRIDGLGQYIYESDILSDSVNFMVENNFESYMNDDKYYLSISACAECSTSINEEGIIYILIEKTASIKIQYVMNILRYRQMDVILIICHLTLKLISLVFLHINYLNNLHIRGYRLRNRIHEPFLFLLSYREE